MVKWNQKTFFSINYTPPEYIASLNAGRVLQAWRNGPRRATCARGRVLGSRLGWMHNCFLTPLMLAVNFRAAMISFSILSLRVFCFAFSWFSSTYRVCSWLKSEATFVNVVWVVFEVWIITEGSEETRKISFLEWNLKEKAMTAATLPLWKASTRRISKASPFFRWVSWLKF